MTEFPPWVVFHVPHDSTIVPDDVRHQFALTGPEMATELLLMTDQHTLGLFGQAVPAAQVICAPVSRLVLDVERFEYDKLEPMAHKGMGVVYTMTHDGKALRHALDEGQRRNLLDSWYLPHHAALTLATENALLNFERALIIDCHSFSSKPLPYEIDQNLTRPEICIGTDGFHTPDGLATIFEAAFKATGWTVLRNAPFSGAMVPSRYFGLDRRVAALMVEVRRDLYMEETTGGQSPSFAQVSLRIRNAILHSLSAWAETA